MLTPTTDKMLRDTTVCIPSFLRDNQLARCLEWLTLAWPQVRIAVAYQCRQHETPEEASQRLARLRLTSRDTIVYLPYDSGVSAARNVVMESATTRYAIFIDDDWIPNRQCGFDQLMVGLQDEALVMGRVVKSEHAEPFYQHCSLLRVAGGIRLVPSNGLYAEYGPQYLAIDLKAQPGLRWDRHIKTKWEHADFFVSNPLMLWLRSDATIRDGGEDFVTSREYRQLRKRDEREYFFAKHGISWLEYPHAMRVYRDSGRLVPANEWRSKCRI